MFAKFILMNQYVHYAKSFNKYVLRENYSYIYELNKLYTTTFGLYTL